MTGIKEIDFFIYGGIALLALAVVLALLSVIVFSITGRSIREKLKREYGEPEKYGMQKLDREAG